MKIRFERFENLIEFLPSIYYYKQTFRKRFGKGAIIIAWLKWGVSIYIKGDKK